MLSAPTPHDYRKLLQEPRAWRPALLEIWNRHKDLLLSSLQTASLAKDALQVSQFSDGENPVFLLSAPPLLEVVVKFYSPFADDHQQPLEKEILLLAQRETALASHTPRVLASGLLASSRRLSASPEARSDEWPGYFLHPKLGVSWRWPYLVLEYVPSRFAANSMWNDGPEDQSPLPQTLPLTPDKVAIAKFLGRYLRTLHESLDPRVSSVLSFLRDGGGDQMNFTAYGSERPNQREFKQSISADPSVPLKLTAVPAYPWHLWTMFTEFISERRFSAVPRYKKLWRKLLSPAQIDQLDSYLPRDAKLLFEHQQAKEFWPSYLHGDLNEDHLLLVPDQPEGKEWSPLKVIDFGDSLIGDRHYDFVAIHISIFRCNKDLLRIFLESYVGAGESPILWPHNPAKFASTCTCYTLLHRQDALRSALRHSPGLRQTNRLEDLGTKLWLV